MADTPRDLILDALEDEELLEDKSVIPTGDLEAVVRIAYILLNRSDLDQHDRARIDEQLWKAELYVKEVDNA